MHSSSKSSPADIADTFRTSLHFENKPDSLPDLGSPISTLLPRPTTSTSTSSSSGIIPVRRSNSGDLSGEFTTSASSPLNNAAPITGNICQSRKIGKAGIAAPRAGRSDVLGSGTGNYGHGSVVRGCAGITTSSGIGKREISNVEEMTRAGNEFYKRGQFVEALRLYEQAVEVCPENSSCRSNRAAALVGMGRLADALGECEEAVRLDSGNARARRRLVGISLRLGLVENAKKHLSFSLQATEPVELQKVHEIERHLVRCESARKVGDWRIALSEADSAIKAGADSSPMLATLRAEALLHLHQLDEADAALLNSAKFESSSPFFLSMKFFGMIPHSYFYIVRAQVDLALGRFENAVAAAEKAKQIDARSIEIAMLLNGVRSVARARALGNELFKAGDFAEACAAYGEGLKYDPSNSVLLCNRAACRSNLGQWEKSVDDCNEALRVQPNYIKALLRRAYSNAKLQRWAEAVRDYEVLRKELPNDSEVAESLLHAQVALRTSRCEDVSSMEIGGEVEKITSLEQFQEALSLSGASVVYFMTSLNQQCSQIAPFVNKLRSGYPSANFFKIDVDESPVIAKAENIRTVPTFRIYKNGTRVEMICPSEQVLEYSVRHYSL